MAVVWKKVLLEGDAASPSDNAPANVGTTAAAGTGTACSRDDHVHDTAPGFIDAADKFAAGVVDTAALGAAAVTSAKIAQLTAALDFGGQQAQDVVIHTVADATALAALTPVVGKLAWQTDELHPYVCTSAV